MVGSQYLRINWFTSLAYRVYNRITQNKISEVQNVLMRVDTSRLVQSKGLVSSCPPASISVLREPLVSTVEPLRKEIKTWEYIRSSIVQSSVDYDPQWPILFEQEKQRLIAALGNRLLMVEHIGSTAVPGLAAKPVIDIDVGIRSFADSPALIPCIERLGYVYEPTLEQLLPERRFFWKGMPSVHTYHLHLAEVDNPVLLRPLQFRDYLRKHPGTAEKYEALKKELAERCGRDIEAYVFGKTEFVENVMLQIDKESKILSTA